MTVAHKIKYLTRQKNAVTLDKTKFRFFVGLVMSEFFEMWKKLKMVKV